MNKSLNQWTREELLALPARIEHPPYDSVLLLSTNEAHDSGWACMAIIGCVAGQPMEVCVRSSDDIEWKMDTKMPVGDFSLGLVRTDCALASGALHFWSRHGKFEVGAPFSSTHIEFIPNAKES